jgi:hypothetical protein
VKSKRKQIALVSQIVSLAYDLVNARTEAKKYQSMLFPGSRFCEKHYKQVTKKWNHWSEQEKHFLDKLGRLVPELAEAGYLNLVPLVRQRPKPWIEVYWDDAGVRGGVRGCWRARVRKDHRLHSAGKSWRAAITDLMLTLKSLDKKHHKGDYRYVMLDYDLRRQGEDHGIAITL